MPAPVARTAPDIFAYLDARAYLADAIAYKQAHERHFSYRKLARLADLASPGYIQAYMAGARNLKPTTAERLAAALGLEGDAREFFVLLVAYTQANNDDTRTRHYEQLLRLAVRHGSGRLDAARLAYFTEWYVPVVHAMANLADFRPDPAWIAARIVPNLRPAEAARALEILAELDIVRTGSDGSIQVAESVLESDPALRSIWLREYHRAMIRLAERSLDLLASEERSINGFTVTVPAEALDTFMRRAEDLLRSLFYDTLAAQQGGQVRGEVVQCNLQVFCLTRIAGEVR